MIQIWNSKLNKTNCRNAIQEQVAQASYGHLHLTQEKNVVSNTHCSALHDCELEWDEAGQLPQRGLSPVEHKGTSMRPSVSPLVIVFILRLEMGALKPEMNN